MRLKGKRVLVTGSRGFVGSHLVRKLKEKGARVVEFDITLDKNILNWTDLAKIRNVSLVYHLASLTFVPRSYVDPKLTYELNVQGTNNVLEFCRRSKAKLVFASSYIYGNPKYLPIDEKHPVSPTNPYARSKVMAEELCRAYWVDFQVPCIILRPFNIYGEGQRPEFLIPEIIHQIKTRRSVTLKDLTPKRDLLYVSDAVRAYILAGEFEGSKFEIFNIGLGKSFSVREVAEKLIDFSGRKLPLKSLRRKRRGEIKDTRASIAKAKRLLGWQPGIGIHKGLKLTLERSS